MNNIIIRNLFQEETGFVIQLAAEEGWNPGLNDIDCFYRADPNAFYIAFADEKPAGCIAAINYGKELGFTGFHIVKKEFRGKGIGKALLEFALQKFGNIPVCSSCFNDQIEFYKKFGFAFLHRIFTFEGIADGKPYNPDGVITPFNYPFDMLYNFVREISPYGDKSFLQQWFNQPKSLLFGIVKNEKYSGCGLFKQCVKGNKIAGLFCDDFKTANTLINALTGHMAKESLFYIDIPEQNTDALRVAESMNLKNAGETIRIFRNQKPLVDLSKVYGFTSLELG
jgi:GNAT superfamily N-acetyltransferase